MMTARGGHRLARAARTQGDLAGCLRVQDRGSNDPGLSSPSSQAECETTITCLRREEVNDVDHGQAAGDAAS